MPLSEFDRESALAREMVCMLWLPERAEARGLPRYQLSPLAQGGGGD